LTAYLNWYSTYGKGVTHIGWQFPFGVAENTSEIRVDTLVLINPVPDRIEPRYGPSADVTVILNDLKTGQPFSCGGPITFENLTPELATLSNYVDLGPQARIRISAIPSGEEKTKALGSTSSTWTLPSGEIKIKVKTPHLLEQNFTITVSPTSTWYVAADGSADFLTIQEAVDTAAPGDTIFVYSGKYNENVVIDKSITVDGEYNKPIIDGGGSGNTVTVLADNVTIKGCEITNSSGSYPDSGIFLDNVRNAVIDSNTIRDNLGRGIFVMWGSNNTITANEIFSNEKAGLRIDGTDANATVTWNYLHDNGEDGVFLYYARNVLIDNNEVDSNLLSGITPQGDSRNITITNNYLWLNHQNAIFTYASSNMTIENNNFNSNGQFGICLWASNNNRIISNEMTNDSLYVAESYGNTVEDNTVNAKPLVYLENATNRIVNDAGQVVLVNCTKITVKGLNLSNTDIGLELWQTSDSLIVDNLFQNNIWSIAAANSSGNTFYHNQFLGNSTEQVHIPSNAANTSNIWDNGYPSGGNYWSDYNGTDANHDGIGDTPYIIDANNVDHYPLMTSWAPTLTVENVVAWRWGGNTTVTCVAAGDVDGDGASEIVAGGYYFDGVRNVALLHVWNGSTLKVENSIPWFWGGDTEVTCIAVGDVDGDGKNEIVTGGYYYDGTRTVAQLHVWDGATLAVKKVQTWYWGGNTTINCLAIADVDGDGQMEIVTGGYYFDGVRNVALLHIWNGSTLAVKKVQSWDWGGDTTVNCLAIGDLYGNGQREIVTGGYYFDGVRRVAQLHIWNGTTLAVVGVQTWYWGGSTEINSVCIGDVDGDGASEIVTGGYYFDGTRNVALLHVWSASLSVERAVPWFWGGDTKALSVAVGDVDGDGKTEVVTGGYYFDGSEKVAQLHVWDGASLAVKDVKTWYWAGNTVVDSMVVSDVNNDLLYEIVTGGTFYYGSYDNAQLMEWSMM
jgi:parallel beta-helix repeat protein